MSLRQFKMELYHARKAFFVYHKGFEYLVNKFFIAKKIFSYDQILEKPINCETLSIHTLTGKRNMGMLLWSLASYYAVAQKRGQL